MPGETTIAMIGGGQMALALADGFCRAGLVDPSRIMVSEPDAVARQRFVDRMPAVQFTSGRQATAAADVVFLAVKPQQAAEACADIAGSLRPEAVVVSIVAGLPLASLKRLAGTERIVRVMPNTPCLVGRGVSAVCRARGVSDDSMARIVALLGAVGTVHAVEEPLLDAITGLSGSGPGFVAMFVEALAAGGVEAGLNDVLAMRLAVETLAGTAALLEQTGEPPARIRERVCSPGGTTLAGLAAMEAEGVARGIAAGVVAARDRAQELGSR